MISIVVPCFNESSNILTLVKRIESAVGSAGFDFEVVLIDDGSRDSTWEVMKNVKNEFRFVQIHQNPFNFGISKTWKIGLEAAVGNYACLIDADLQNQPEDIPILYRKFISGDCSIIQGVRVPETIDNIRYIYSKCLNFILNFIFRDNASDSKSGFVIGHREDLIKVVSHKFRYFHFQTFIRISAKSLGLSLGEHETKFCNRYSGESFIVGKKIFLVPIQVILDIPMAILEFNLRKINKNV